MSRLSFSNPLSLCIRPLARTSSLHASRRFRRKHPLLVSVHSKKENEGKDPLEQVQEWSDKIFSQIAVLRAELARLQMEELGAKPPPKSETSSQTMPVINAALITMLHELIDKRERFFREERNYWIKERNRWAEQELELKKEIARLQNLFVAYGMNTQLQPIQPPPPQESSKEDDSMLKDETVDFHVKESLAAAITAVDTEDVLSETFTFVLKPTLNNTEESRPEKETDSENSTSELIENVKSPPTGPPPSLTIGDDDIYWVSQLQEALNMKGYFCGDEEAEDFYFGEGTQSALLTFQACQGIEETGVTDSATWKELLGPELQPVIGNVDSESTPKTVQNVKATDEKTTFPVLSEFDGGNDVHCLQVMLDIAGYSCGKDDMMWWHYGDNTIAAVKTYQACNGLPQSGVADAATWATLTGIGMTMEDVRRRVKEEGTFEEDMTQSNRVWLIGEQRWEDTI